MNKTTLLSAALLISAQCAFAQSEDKTLVVVAGQESALAYNQGIKDHNNKNFAVANDNYTKALQTNQQFYQALYNRGLAELSQNKNGDAQNDFNQAVSLNENPRYYLARSVSNARLRHFKEALQDIDKAQNLGYDNAEIAYFRGMVYLLAGNYSEAEKQYNFAVSANNRLAKAYCDRGTAHYLRSNYKAAIDDYNTAIEIDHSATYAYVFRAQAKAEQGNISAAIADINTALEINPDDYDLINTRGQLQAKNKKYDKAAADFDALIEKYPDEPSAYISYGNMYFDRQQFEKAKEYFTKAIEKDPYNYIAYNNRANASEMLFETKNADSDRKKAESFLNPKL